MKLPFILVSLFAVMLAPSALCQPTAFTYQGRLSDAGAPATGTYDFEFTLWDSLSGGSAASPSVLGTPGGVGVTNGLFTVILDFGAGALNGAPRWIQLGVRTNGSVAAFVTVTPREAVPVVPYAVFATTASNVVAGAIGNSALAVNAVTADKIAGAAVVKGINNLKDAVTIQAGSNLVVSTTGSTITLSGTTGPAWGLNGNAGIGTTNFLGTTDQKALDFRVGGARALRLEPNSSGQPNVIGGHANNAVAAGVVSAVIAGGGDPGAGASNSVASSYGTVGGGLRNTIRAGASGGVVGGGTGNVVEGGSYGVIGGGAYNLVQAGQSSVLGGYNNIVRSNAANSAILSGANNLISNNATYAVIAGGDRNLIGPGSAHANVAGGLQNTNLAVRSTIGGGSLNTILSNSFDSVITGGRQNTIQDNISYGAIGGGLRNTLQSGANYSSVVGGVDNVIQSNSAVGAILGGYQNVIQTNVSSGLIAGGSYHVISNNANFGTIMGGSLNAVGGSYSLAAGYRAKAIHSGSFVWSDPTGGDLATTGSNQFLIRAAGGVGIGTNKPATLLHVQGTVTATNFVGSGAGLSNLLPTSLTGVLAAGQIPNLDASKIITGTLGAALIPNLDASKVSTGTLGDARLSANVALLNRANVFTETNRLVGVVIATNANNRFVGEFSGNGTTITNLSLLNVDTQGAITRMRNAVFTTASSPTVGSSPQSVIAADVNGDGKPDLISANYYGNSLTVLTNNGSGAFVLASTPSVGFAPSSVVAAELFGDGKLELISANKDANTLSVLANSGGGTFTLATSLSVGNGPSWVVAADINGDGKLDLIAANSYANTLSVLTNNGSGGFGLASSPSVGTYPLCVIAVDVNGDGKLDLITANGGNNTLSVLTNNGTGGFVLASSPTVGSFPQSVAAADLNGDGKLDLITANYWSDTLTVLTNNGSGGFVLATSLGVGFGPISLVAADVNRDGKVDLVSANYYQNTLSVLINKGSGDFMLASVAGVGSGPSSVTAADLNGDGEMDLISANYNASSLSILTNAPVFTWNFAGDGGSLTGLKPSALNGVLRPDQIPLLDATKIGSGTLDPAQIPNLDASKLTSGYLDDNRLSANVALLNSSPVFSGTVTASRFVGAFAGGGLAWEVAQGTVQQAVPNSGYLITNDTTQVTIALPPAPSVGDIVRIAGAGAAGWKIAQNASQKIRSENFTSSWRESYGGGNVIIYGLASSADGNKVVAIGPRNIFTSTDSGESWRIAADTAEMNWWAVASSADGNKLVAVVKGGQIYTSTDSGLNWTARENVRQWWAVASSADGTKLVAVVGGGQIYTSTDSGLTWTARESARGWISVASSADGSKLIAGVDYGSCCGGPIYRSTDSGVSWAPIETGTDKSWLNIAGSEDGAKLIAIAGSGIGAGKTRLFISTDSGMSWVAREKERYWKAIASSATGNKLIAATSVGGQNGGQIWVSTDSGITWTPRVSDRYWTAVASSSDGNKLVAASISIPAVGAGYIFTFNGMTTVGPAGYLIGAQSAAVELQYLGNNEFLPVSYAGSILAY